jgi:Lrp/AsnC family transcriptional regulator, regulator for asnA, asnC and gidA
MIITFNIMRLQIISKSKSDKRIDKIDLDIIELLSIDKNNKEISTDLKIPLSTIQRRVKHLITAGYVSSHTQINYQKFGFKTGLLHVYLKDDNIEEMARKINDLNQITSVEIHIGNSDILGHVIYKEGKELLNLISAIKRMQGVDRIVWSERIYQSPSKEYKNIINIFNREENQGFS